MPLFGIEDMIPLFNVKDMMAWSSVEYKPVAPSDEPLHCGGQNQDIEQAHVGFPIFG
jgi:hypothetical protein